MLQEILLSYYHNLIEGKRTEEKKELAVMAWRHDGPTWDEEEGAIQRLLEVDKGSRLWETTVGREKSDRNLQSTVLKTVDVIYHIILSYQLSHDMAISPSENVSQKPGPNRV